MCRYLQRQPLLLILVLLIVLAPTSMVRAPALVSQRMRSSTPSFRSLRNSKSRSRKSLLLRIGCPVWIHISRRHLRISRPDLQRWHIISAPSLHVCERSRHMQPQHQMYPVGAFIIPALDARSHVLSMKDRRNGIGKLVFKLAPLGSGQTFTLVAPVLCVLGVSPEVLQRVLSEANRPHV